VRLGNRRNGVFVHQYWAPVAVILQNHANRQVVFESCAEPDAGVTGRSTLPPIPVRGMRYVFSRRNVGCWICVATDRQVWRSKESLERRVHDRLCHSSVKCLELRAVRFGAEGVPGSEYGV
jgi:hypothetical protein